MLSKNKLKEMYGLAVTENQKLEITVAILLHEINNKLNKTKEVKHNDKIGVDSKGGKKT